MNHQAHADKAARIERSLGKVADADFETVIEAAMLAGTHWFNIILHKAGLRPEDRDAMHSEFLTHGERRRVALVVPEALATMDAIEALRTTHVRGDMPGGETAAKTARACLAHLRRFVQTS